MSKRETIVRLGVAVAVAAGISAPVAAQAQESFPSKPLSMYVLGLGGSVEAVVRGLAAGIGDQLGRNVVVEGRPGGAGTVAAVATLRAPNDGHTLLFIHSSAMTINPLVTTGIGYDTVRDFVALSQLCGSGGTVVALPTNAVRNAADLVSQGKAKPGQISIALAGMGNRVALAQLGILTGARFNEVLYPSEPAMMSAVLGGHVDLAILNPGTAKAQADAGKMRLVANTSPNRMSAMPDVQTVSEVAPGWEFYNWFGLYVPSAVPKDRIDRLAGAVLTTARGAPFQALCQAANLEPLASTSQEAQSRIRREIERNAGTIKAANIKLD